MTSLAPGMPPLPPRFLKLPLDHRGYPVPKFVWRKPDGGYLLRETAQTPKEDLSALQDIGRHRYVNTNNLWLDLQALRDVMSERAGVLAQVSELVRGFTEPIPLPYVTEVFTRT